MNRYGECAERGAEDLARRLSRCEFQQTKLMRFLKKARPFYISKMVQLLVETH